MEPRNGDLFAEWRGLGRLIDALPFTVEHPSVVEAANRLAFHPANRELRLAVGAVESHEVALPLSPR